jgi:hypothetical protein
VNPDPANARRVWQALLKFGAPLSGFSPDDFSKPDVVFQMGAPPVRIDLLTSIDGVEWNEAWAGRLVKEVEGVRVPVLSSEHVIRNKRATGRPQDLVDADILERRLSKHKKS